MAIVVENNMVILTGVNQTLTSFCFTEHIKQYLRTENGYTLIFRLDDNTEDFVNMLDAADELGVQAHIDDAAFFMRPVDIDPTVPAILNTSDIVLADFAVQYDIDNPVVTLNMTYLCDVKYRAKMIKLGKHTEVSSSNMPVDILYKMKFIVERNEEMLIAGWTKKQERTTHGT